MEGSTELNCVKRGSKLGAHITFRTLNLNLEKVERAQIINCWNMPKLSTPDLL